MEQIARHIFFRGRVQGVGFRYTVRQMAGRHGLTGTVRNLPDGSVEAVLQGPPGGVRDCIDEVQAHFRSYLRGIDATEMVFNPNLTDFSIIF